MSKYHQKRAAPSGTTNPSQDGWDMDIAISAAAKQLRQEGRLNDALHLLEIRVSDVLARDLRHFDGTRSCLVPAASKIDSIVVFQAARLHFELSKESGDQHHQRAKSLLVVALQADKTDWGSWQLLGDLYQQEKAVEDGGRCYVEAIKCDQNGIPAYGKLCGVLCLLDRVDVARKVAMRMMQLDEQNLVGLNILAQIELKSGDIDAARRTTNRLIELDPLNAMAWRTKSHVEMAAGDIVEARAATDRQIQLESSTPVA